MNCKIKFEPSEFLYHKHIKSCRIKLNTCVLVLLVFCLRELMSCTYKNNTITNLRKTDTDSEIIIRQDINRIFIKKKNSELITFHFPFKVKLKETKKTFKIYYKDVHINAIMIECIKIFLQDLGYPDLEINDSQNETNQNNKTISFDRIKDSFEKIEDLSRTEFFSDLNEEVVNKEIRNIKNTIISLLNIDYGYARYDYDEINENGKIHPLQHIDIYTHNNCSMKIGVDTDYSIHDFIDLFDKTTDCNYLK